MTVRRVEPISRDENEDRRMTTTGWTQTPVVYVIQEDSGKNMTSALDHGSVECLLQQREEATMLNIPTLVEKLRYGLPELYPQRLLASQWQPCFYRAGLCHCVGYDGRAV